MTFYLTFRQQARNFRETNGGGLLVLVLRSLLVLFVSTFCLIFRGLYRIVSSSIPLVLVLVLGGLFVLIVSTFGLSFIELVRNVSYSILLVLVLRSLLVLFVLTFYFTFRQQARNF